MWTCSMRLGLVHETKMAGFVGARRGKGNSRWPRTAAEEAEGGAAEAMELGGPEQSQEEEVVGNRVRGLSSLQHPGRGRRCEPRAIKIEMVHGRSGPRRGRHGRRRGRQREGLAGVHGKAWRGVE